MRASAHDDRHAIMTADEGIDIAAEVARHGTWYHRLDLGNGVVTPGHVDLRTVAPDALPASLAGKRCLDVGTFDGYWAFEMERRGALDVVALDVDDPAETDMLPATRARYERGEMGQLQWGEGFRIAHSALASSARRVAGNIYSVSPGLVGGRIDLILCGSLLQHLRDPVGGLERLRETLTPDGEVIVIETVMKAPRRWRNRPIVEFYAQRGGQYTWWLASEAALRDWLTTAGFTKVETLATHALSGLTEGHTIAVVRAQA